MIHNPEKKPKYVLFTIHSVFGPSHRYIYSREEAEAEVAAKKDYLIWYDIVDVGALTSEEPKDV